MFSLHFHYSWWNCRSRNCRMYTLSFANVGVERRWCRTKNCELELAKPFVKSILNEKVSWFHILFKAFCWRHFADITRRQSQGTKTSTGRDSKCSAHNENKFKRKIENLSESFPKEGKNEKVRMTTKRTFFFMHDLLGKRKTKLEERSRDNAGEEFCVTKLFSILIFLITN